MDEETKNEGQEQTPETPKDTKNGNKLFYSIAAIIFLGTIALFAVLYTHITKQALTVFEQKKEQEPNMYPNFTQEQLQIKQISTPFKRFNIVAKNGHYIGETGVQNGSGKIVSDGKVIYTGEILSFSSQLSDDGKHYLVLTPNSLLYDGKLVYQGKDLYLSLLSNNGEKYLYATLPKKFPLGVNMYVNGKLIVKDVENFYDLLKVTNDGNVFYFSYFGKLGSGKIRVHKNNDVVMETDNIENITIDDSGNITETPYAVYSENKKHNLTFKKDPKRCDKCESVYADGKLITTLQESIISSFLINDEGKYAFYKHPDKIYLQSKLFAVPVVYQAKPTPEYKEGEVFEKALDQLDPQTKPISPVDVQINKSQTHYLLQYHGASCSLESIWYLDGKQAQLPIQSCDDYVELREDTLYIYNVVKDGTVAYPAANSPDLPMYDN